MNMSKIFWTTFCVNWFYISMWLPSDYPLYQDYRLWTRSVISFYNICNILNVIDLFVGSFCCWVLPLWRVSVGHHRVLFSVIFKQVHAKAHQPISWLDGPQNERGGLGHGVVAEYFLLRVVFDHLARGVAVQGGFLWEPQDGELRSLPWEAVQQVPTEIYRERNPVKKINH